MPLAPSNNKAILYQDTLTGIYKDADGSWFLKDGTPIQDYDPNTGAYQEESGTWYTFQGTELSYYDKTTGVYKEVNDNTYYSKDGVPLDATTKQPVQGASPVPKKALSKAAPKSLTPLYIGIAVIAIAFIAITMSLKGKKK
jgi:hypothetical protein